MDHSLPGSYVHGILQARILEWAAMPSSGGFSHSRIKPIFLLFPALAGRFLTTGAIWKAINSVQFSHSVVSNSETPWTAAHQASLSITNSQSLFRLMSIESVMAPNHLILCCPLLFLPSVFPSIRVFSNESVCIRWPKY